LFCAVFLVVIGSLPGVALADPTPSGQTGKQDKQDMLAGVLHGEGIVQTKKGPVRVAMQNGTATATTGTSLTIRSADGYTKSWTLAENVKVFENHKSVQPDAIQAGSTVVVGGPITVNGGAAAPSATPTTTYTAEIVLVRSAPAAEPSAS
jgi:ferric-dicitrate binding protein FerR (iron transport regulator)